MQSSVALVKTLPSAIRSAVASPRMSDRYVHISTLDVVKQMQELGYAVAEAKVDQVQRRDPAFARHMVTFRKEETKARKLNEYTPQINFVNSHNGTVKASFFLGVYRFVCMNGMVVGSTYAAESFKHSGDIARDVQSRIKSLTDSYGPLFKQIDAWKAKKLTKAKQIELATIAAGLRFGDKGGQYDPVLLLGVKRTEDDAGDAWSTFNRIQENCTRGGIVGANSTGRRVTSKTLAGIGLDVTFNKALWTATEQLVGA